MNEPMPGERVRDQIEEKVRELLRTKLRVSAEALNGSDSTTPLLGSGIGLDSMEAMALAVEIEEEFSIVVPDEDLTEDLFASLRTLADYIVNRRDRA